MSANHRIGQVGYTFRKEFDEGWFIGRVIKIRKGAANGKDRRCIYEDGDMEDLSIAELKALHRLDPNNSHKPSRSRSISPKPPPAALSTKPGTHSGNSSVSSSTNIRRSGRELTANVRHVDYINHNGPTNNDSSKETRRSSRERRPARTYDEVLLAQEHLKHKKNGTKRRLSSRSSSTGQSLNKIRKLLSSLDDDDVPVDKAAECTFQTEKGINEGEGGTDEDSENEQNEWLEKVASQLGARPMSRSGLYSVSGSSSPVVHSRPMSRCNSVENSTHRTELELWQSKMAVVQNHQQLQDSCTKELSQQCKRDNDMSEENYSVPSSVLVHKSDVTPPGSSGGTIRTLIDVDKGSRHEYLVVSKDDPDRIAGEVLIEGKSGWVEVSFGGDELVKCRSSHLIVLPRRKCSIGDSVPKEYLGIPSADDVKSSSGGDKKTFGKKPSPRRKQQSLNLDDIFYWVCECETFNTTTDQACHSCHKERSPDAKVSKLLQIAEEVVKNEFVCTLEEAMVQIPENERQSIPELILAQLLDAKIAGLDACKVAAEPCTKIETFFYWSCGCCTMRNSFRKGFCQTCREARGYFARSSPLFAIAEKIALESKSPEDAYAKWPAHETKQIPAVVMDTLITCVHIIRRKGYERRCRNRKLDGVDYCQDHCDPALLTASRVNNMQEQAEKNGEEDSSIQPTKEERSARRPPTGIDAMKQSLNAFLTTKIDNIGNTLGWSVNNIEDSFICDSDSKPFPLGLKVRTYFLGYGFHDGRIIKVRRQFNDDRPVLVYRVVYNDGDQQDYLHHNISSLRQCYDINNIDPSEDVEEQIPPGNLYELKSGVVVEVVGHTISPQNEQFISFNVQDDSNKSLERLELSLLKFQTAVRRKVNPSSDEERASTAYAVEWPVSHDRIDPTCSVGNGLRYKVCNGLHLLSKVHNLDYSGGDAIQKLPNVDDPRDARPGVKISRYDPANIYDYAHWDPSQCLVCELCGVDKDDNQVIICEKCHLGFHSYCLRPVMVNIPTSEWICRQCSGHDNAISFVDYFNSITGQQQSVLQFLNLPYTSYSDFLKENSQAISYSQAPTPFNPSQHTSIDRNLFSVGPILFVRAPDRHDFRLPSLATSEEEYASIIESFVAAMKYCGMSKYSLENIYPSNGNVTEEMNNPALERDHISPLSKRNLSIFRAFKENMKKGVFPPIKVKYDERYGFYIEAVKAIPKHTLISDYTGEVITLEESSESDSLMILLDSGDPNTSLIIDPTNAGNIARFLSGVNNKSLVSKRKANVRTRRFCLDEKLHVVLFTSRRIEPGEKLNYDYNAGRKGQSSEEWLKGGFYDTSNFF